MGFLGRDPTSTGSSRWWRSKSGTRFAVATVNGTSALHICLLLAGVEAG